MVESTFSIPLRHRWSTDFAGDLVTLDERACGLDRFVGDQSNLVLRFLENQPARLFTDASADHLWPLVLFGPSGTGKTSLALTLISDITEFNQKSGTPKPEVKPIVLTAVDFDRRYRASIGSNAVDDFRKRFYRSRGVVVDDIHHLADKRAAQAELVHLIDQMQRRNRPLIATLNQDPLCCDDLIPALVSRCLGGMCLPVHKPGRDAREIILKDLSHWFGIQFTEDAIEWLVDRLCVNVPSFFNFFHQLQTRLRASASDPDKSNATIDVSFLIRMFHRSDSEIENLAKFILKQVAKEFKIKLADLRSSSRKQSLVSARGVAVYLIRKLTAMPFGKIGALLGHRDHSTIMHAFEKTEKFLDQSPQIASEPGNSIQLATRNLQQRLANSITLEGSL